MTLFFHGSTMAMRLRECGLETASKSRQVTADHSALLLPGAMLAE
jgi:hypothetical protein